MGRPSTAREKREETVNILLSHELVLWVVTPCSHVVMYQRFGAPCFLHLRGEVEGIMDGVTTHKTTA